MTATAVRRPGPAPSNPHARQDVRRTLLALLASGMGVLPLSELITDNSWLLDVWLTMIVVIAPAAVLRLRRVPSAGQIWIGLLLLVPWLTVRFLHVHAYGGVIPSRRTWHDLIDLMTALHRTTTVQAAPVHSTPAIKLALCLLLGLVAALVDLTAVVGRRGALAGVPLLVVFTVSGAVPRHPVSWWLFAVAAGGFLILLALDSSDDLHRWGHFVPRTTPVTTRTAATGQRVAVVAIALAVVLPAFLPSDSRNLLANLFHNGGSTGLDTGFGRGGGSSGIDPFVALKGQLNRKDPQNLFDVTVRSGVGGRINTEAGAQLFYARTNVLSRFTGDGWAPGDPGANESVDNTRFESSPGQQFPPQSQTYSLHVSDRDLTSNPPIFAVPTAVSGLSSKTTWNPQDQLLENTKIEPGDDYDLTVAQPTPSVPLLNAASGNDPALNAWLTQPDVPDFVHTLVRRLTANAQTPYQRARAISDYFTAPTSGFVYSLSTVNGDSGNALVDFLKTKTGYCQQYAAAMGVMLRLAGVPSRVVLGYTHPLPSQDGTFTVTTNDAHAWDEAYFAGVGWIPFDPTPIAGIPGGATTNLPWAPHAKQGDTNPSTRPSVSRSVGPVPRRSSAPVTTPVARSAAGSSSAAALVIVGIVVLVLLMLFVPWAFRELRRRRRVQRARHGDTDALWAELSDTAIDLGYVWSSARTPRQVAQWLMTPAGVASGSLQHMADTVERVRYAPDGGSVDGSTLVADLAAVRSGLRAGRSSGERVRASLLPASLGWRVVRWVRSWGGGRRRR